MAEVIQIKGNVKYPIYIDAGVWIFDDRKFNIEDWHPEKLAQEDSEQVNYLKSVSSQWDKEIIEGSSPPPAEKPAKKTKKQELIEGNFVIAFKPFILNAEPMQDASKVIIHTIDEDLEFSLEEALAFIAGFSLNGKPLPEETGGPLYLYKGDGSNRDQPIKYVTSITIV
ncbi:peptidyl-prolyl cis-trans isomerase [Pradoshia sp.]